MNNLNKFAGCEVVSETANYWVLVKACLIPWFILVPKKHIDDSQEEELFIEAFRFYRKLKPLYPGYKYNLAKIGNKTPVFHIHLVFRQPEDILWPEPIWCRENELEFSEVEVNKIRKYLETNNE
jgi:diadenosine tetraphosphate (Ap4A) HIT family hydrolase